MRPIDQAIAAQTGMRFIGVGERFGDGDFNGTPVIPNLHHLDATLAELPVLEEFLIGH